METYAIILAAGKGTRMKSTLPKVMHKVSGIPMLEHITRTAKNIGVKHTYIVIGHGSEYVRKHFENQEGITFVEQKEQLGTAHAVKQATNVMAGIKGEVLILTGDTPLISEKTLNQLLEARGNSNGVVLTAIQEDPFGYGRIKRDEKGRVVSIVEEKDATETEKKINEVNTGIFSLNIETLKEALKEVNNKNSQREYYLTDIVEIVGRNGKHMKTAKTNNWDEVLGVNDRYQLAKVENLHQDLVKKQHMQNGVTIKGFESVYIETDVEIEPNVTIEGNVSLKGKTKIKEMAFIGRSTELIDVEVGVGTRIIHSYVQNSKIGKFVNIGPYAHIRPESEIGDEAKIGNFVEVKKSKIQAKSKVSHLSYIGDAEIGKDVNIGCGTITVNYDGENKHKTEIEDGAFVGCNVNLVAPVKVGKNSIVAAGSTITDEVPENALAIARQRQTNKENYKK